MTAGFLLLLTLASTVGFDRVFADGRWVVPVVAEAVILHGVCWALRRRRLPDPLPILVGLGVAAVVAVYLVFPTSLSYGLPLGRSWTTVHAAIVAGRAQIRTMVTPIPASPALTLLAVWAVGAAAVLADWLTFRVRTALQGVAPAFALFIICCALGSPRGRSWSVGAEVAGIAAFLLAHRAAVNGRVGPWFGGKPRTPPTDALAFGALSAAVAVVAAIAVVPALPRSEGTGVLGWKSLNANASRITPSPFDDLRTRLITEAPNEVMTVQSAVPSYWRLTSLDTFTGQVWESTNSYQGVSGRLPGVTPPPPGTRRVEESFQIEGLDSIWLPAAFDPQSVRARQPVTWDPQSASLISSKPTVNGESYEVTSIQELSKLNPAALSTAPAPDAATMARDLRLPPMPASVVQLARQITASQSTEYDKALALEQYFHQPIFTYSLSPPSDDSTTALEDFLFRTRTGYCQQFAGAYAVLARLAGLPTRIAIGFQAGTLQSDGLYHVDDSDAHAWPEVYFPTVGWVPFEPTPGRQVPGATAYTGVTNTTTPTPGNQRGPGFDRPQPTSGAQPPAPGQVPPTTVPISAPATSNTTRSADWTPAATAGGVLVGRAGAWVGGLALVRRWRWRRRRRRAANDPVARIQVAWAETAERLARWDTWREPDETIGEFATRVGSDLAYLLDGSSDRHAGRRPGGHSGWHGGDDGGFAELATLVQRATFAAVPLADGQAARADAIAAIVGRRLDDARPARRRLAQLVRPIATRSPAARAVERRVPVVFSSR